MFYNLLILTVALFISSIHCDRNPKRYIINLDDEPSSRWNEVAYDFCDKHIQLETFLYGMVPIDVIPYLNKLVEKFDSQISEEQKEEMKGFSETFGMGLGKIFTFNMIYELTHLCTSIVAEDSEGNVIHGRNMDYVYHDILRNFIIDVEFHRQSKMVYKATTFVGYIGVLTGMKPNAFTITLNQRRKENGHWKNAIIMMIFEYVKLCGFLIRDTLDSASDFETAVNSISKTNTMAPAYYIVGGIKKGQSVVISKDDLITDDFRYTDDESWYVLQTNYDWWLKVPESDDRRSFALKYMDDLGRKNATLDGLYEVLSKKPILSNINQTIYTTVMSAAKPGFFRSVIRDIPTRADESRSKFKRSES